MRKTKDIHPTSIPNYPSVQLAVHNFGPVEKAEMDLRPLTVFVGASNTGKTYLAALIYALHRTFEGFSRSLTPQRQIALNKPHVFRDELKRCFEVETVSELIRFRADPSNEMQVSLQGGYQTAWAFDMRATRSDFAVNGNAVNEAVDGRAQNEGRMQETLPDGLWPSNSSAPSEVYYLPAGRRSLLQNCDVLANSVVQGTVMSSPFSGITVDFLKHIINYNERDIASDRIRGIAKALEDEVLHGKIDIRGTIPEGTPEFLYRPQKSEQALRLSQSSSMVSELAPLVLFLRGVIRPGDTLIIEEPEAHLHPRDQTKLAITFARLVRAGVRVIVTTHSDWLLQQIGNLIREGEVMKLGKNRTEPETWLTEGEVGAWWFRTDKPVKEIQFDCIEGIEPKDYYNVAEELYNNAVEFQQHLLNEEELGDNE